jgi:hypothetical protein
MPFTINDGNFYIKNRKRLENKMDVTNSIEGFDVISNNIQQPNTNKQIFNNTLPATPIYGGPVVDKNMDDFNELKELQLEYNRELQEYNNAIQSLMNNTKLYIDASNKSNNKYQNSWIQDPSSGTIGYVTTKGVWKPMPNTNIGNSIQGKRGCPTNLNQVLSISPDKGEKYSIATAPYDTIVKTGGVALIKGDPIINNQTCSGAGNNVYITEPAPTTNLQYTGCSSSHGEYQADLGNNTIYACRQRAADKGYNSFQLGQNTGSNQVTCYIGDNGNNAIDGSKCPYISGIGNVGSNVQGSYSTPTIQNNNPWFMFWMPQWTPPQWTPGYTSYASYTMSGANIDSLGSTYYITDDLKKVKYPDNLITSEGENFLFVGNYNSIGNDITSGSGLSLEQVKDKCLKTPGATGFVMTNDGRYYIKNKNMWPRGNRQTDPNIQLYIRNTMVVNHNSCSKVVEFSTQDNILGYMDSGETMTSSKKCSLGLISKRDFTDINNKYQKLNKLLDKMYAKITELTKLDVNLNKKLLSEHRLLKKNLQKYENTYKEIRNEDSLIQQNLALEDDANIQMLSYNTKYIIWSMLALGITIGTMRMLKAT